PQDRAAIGLPSPLKGYDAAADPTVRTGSNGLFSFSGIVFQRNVPVATNRPVTDDESEASMDPASTLREGPTRAAEQRRKLDRERRKRSEKAREMKKESARKEKREPAEKRERQERAEKAHGKADGGQGGRERSTNRAIANMEDDDDDDDDQAGSTTSSAVFVSTFIDLNKDRKSTR